MIADGDDDDDLGGVPEHRGDVREEEAAVAVEDPEAPGREHEEADAREHDPQQRDGEVEPLAREARASAAG